MANVTRPRSSATPVGATAPGRPPGTETVVDLSPPERGRRDLPRVGASAPSLSPLLTPTLSVEPTDRGALPYDPEELLKTDVLGGIFSLVSTTQHQLKALTPTPKEARAARVRVSLSLTAAVGSLIAGATVEGEAVVESVSIALLLYFALTLLGQIGVNSALLSAYRRHLALGGEVRESRFGTDAQYLGWMALNAATSGAYFLLLLALGRFSV